MKGWILGLAAGLVFAGGVTAGYKIDGWGRVSYINEGEVLGNQVGEEWDEAEFERVLRDMEKELAADEVMLDSEDGFLNLTATDGGGLQAEIGSQKEVVVDERWDMAKLRVIAGESGQTRIESDGVTAATDLEVAVKTENNALSVGNQILTIMPDEVVKKLLADNVFDNPGDYMGISVDLSTGGLVYEATGTSEQKVLGLWRVKLSRKVWVSAQTNERLRVEMNPVDRLVDWVSF